MRRIIVTLGLCISGITAFCQQEENGTIYIKHPNIDAVNKAQKAYVDKDVTTLKTIYSDTAKFWGSGMEKFIPIADAMKMWMSDYDKFDEIDQKTFGYPDYLQYKKDDSKTVQSWWTLSGKSKKTGEVVKIPMVQFDDFNNDGKIVREYVYGDFSKWISGSNANEEQAVRQVISNLTKALQENNAGKLDSIYADQFIFVGDNGKRQTKAERLASFKSGKVKYQSIDIRVADLKMYRDVAVAFMDVNTKATTDGKQSGGHFLTTATFTKNNGRWVEVAASNIRLAK